MITSNRIPYKIKCGAIGTFLMFTSSLSAQQLHSDSVVAAKTEQSLCMVLPDTTLIFDQINSSQLSGISAANFDVSQIFVQSCGECFTHTQNYFNFASLFVTPAWTGCCVVFPPLPPGAYVVIEPIGAECKLGITASSGTEGVQFAAYISNAVQQLSAIAHDSASDSSALT